MKSIKQQYIDLQEGKMTQHNFMRNLRMSMPQYINNVTSFDDSIKILKNKGILTEAYSAQDIIKKYNEMFGRNPQTKFEDVARALNVPEDEVSKAMMSVTPGGPGSLKLREKSVEPKLYSIDPKLQLLKKAKLLTLDEIHEVLNDIATGWEGTVSNKVSTELYNAISQADGNTIDYLLKDTRWYKGGYKDIKTMLEDLINVSKYISPKSEEDEWSAGENDPDHPNFDKAQAWGYEKRMHSED